MYLRPSTNHPATKPKEEQTRSKEKIRKMHLKAVLGLLDLGVQVVKEALGVQGPGGGGIDVQGPEGRAVHRQP